MLKVLITYASRHRSTADIATAIGEVLSEADVLTIELRPVEHVTSIDGYDAVILGSAVYAGQWMPSAVTFLKTYEQELALRPVWLFSSGPTGVGNPVKLLDGWHLPEKVQPIAQRIAPRSIAVFHGKLNPAELNTFERFIVRTVAAPVGDFRDWDQIREWAMDVTLALVEFQSHLHPSRNVVPDIAP